jgi:hypothetical protein
MHFTGDLADHYDDWIDKGPVKDGRRLTIMTARDRVQAGQEVQVVHVVEATEPGLDVYLMGPKEVFGEAVDGHVANPLPEGMDPFAPAEYDGRVATGPAVDANYDVTTYTFDAPGEHQIVWRLAGWTSNVLRVTVV